MENRHKSVKTGNASKKRWWIVLLLIVAALAVSGLVATTRKAAPATSDGGTFTVRRDNLTVTVTEGGSIRARKSIDYNCEVARRGGEITILHIVPTGTYITQEDVNNGRVLVELDSSALKEQLTRSRLDLATEQGNLTSATEANDIQVLQNESDIAADQLRVRFALMALEKYLGMQLTDMLTKDTKGISDVADYFAPFLQKVRDDPNLLDGSAAGQELKRLNDDIVLAQGNLKTAQATLAGTERLHDANYVSDLDLERDRLAVVNRLFVQQNAQVSLDLFMRYDFPKNAEQYFSDYVEANLQLKRTHAQCRSRLAQAQARVTNANEHVVEETGAVKWYESLIDKCIIRAKAPGLVIYGTGGSGDVLRAMRGGRSGGGGGGGIIAEGEAVYEGQTLISIPDTADMIAEVSVHETEVDKVRSGQAATIVMDAFPDRLLQGKVLEVAPLPDEQRGFLNPDLKVYPTKVSIDGRYDFLRTRMSCKVRILVEQLEDVIIVPIQVVSNRGGRKVCYVKTSQGTQERQVQTGAFNDMFVQILEGLDVGDEVLLNPPALFNESMDSTVFQQQVQQPKEAAAEPAQAEVGSGAEESP